MRPYVVSVAQMPQILVGMLKTSATLQPTILYMNTGPQKGEYIYSQSL